MKENEDMREPTCWRQEGWIAKVIPNDDGEGGWAIAMTRIGDTEAALVGPWTMGRDKKNPKPIDSQSFRTLVKTANEILARHEQAALARVHKHFEYTRFDGQIVAVNLDVAGDDDDPHAILTCTDRITGEALRSGRVKVGFRLDATTIDRFLAEG